jgi:hypothetical protein
VSEPTIPAATPPAENRPGPHVEVDVYAREGHVKEGRIQQHAHSFTVMCDEGPQIGGTDTAPTPLGYFTLAMGF